MTTLSDWTLVTLKRRPLFKEALSTTIIAASPFPKKRVTPESLQALIRTRLHHGLTQQEADHLCSFPRHTFNKIESHLMVPSGEQQIHIQRHLGVSLLVAP
jgi:hypothetical protein